MKLSRQKFIQSSLAGLAGASSLNAASSQSIKNFGKIKSVIYLHMAGSPSQLDLFDDKPMLRKFNGKDCPNELLEGKRFAFLKGVPKLLGSPFSFKQYGKSGAEVSELLPEFSKMTDDVCLVKSVQTDAFNHAPAQLLLHTGSQQFGSASMGSWVNYAKPSENKNLPGYIVLNSGGKSPSSGKSVWGSGFLPSVYQGVKCRSVGDPILYTSNPAGISRDLRRMTLDTIGSMNKYRYANHLDSENITRSKQYELAFRMQETVPDAMDLTQEPEDILKLYGAKPNFKSNVIGADDPREVYKSDDPTFSNNCLLARRLVERGVRFVQLYDWGWDHHGTNFGETIDHTLPIKAKQIDRGISGLIKDLKRSGLLEETLIVWGGEFGRTPMLQKGRANPAGLGRDHQADAFTMWFAGGGINSGGHFGETDELGASAIQDQVHVRDVQATVLHLLGLDPYRLSYPSQGLDMRLIGPTNEAKVIKKLLA